MKRGSGASGFSLLSVGSLAAAAIFFVPSVPLLAQNPGPPPNILVIQQEMVKPGMAGMAHGKSESAFVQAMKQAKSPVHYTMMTSLTGRDRALTVMGFDSFADWEKTMMSVRKDKDLSGELDNDMQADGKMLSGFSSGVFVYRPEMSQSPNVEIAKMRFMEITVIQLKPGHTEDWKQLVKLHQEIFGRVAGVHSAMWEQYYGDQGGLYLVTMPFHSLADLDALRTENEKAAQAAGVERMKQMHALVEAAFASVHTNLYAFSPSMSYVSDSWKQEAPDFWGK